MTQRHTFGKRSFRGKLIGLTGGIGAGKNTLAALFEEWGAYVLDSDKTAREVIQQGTKGYQEVIRAFGEGILDKTGEINRPLLANIVFHDKTKRTELEQIIHPLIKAFDTECIRRILTESPERVIVKNTPLLFETSLSEECFATVLVTAKKEKRIERVLKKIPQAEREEITARMDVQMPEEEKIKRADFTLFNNGTIEELRCEATEKLYQFF